MNLKQIPFIKISIFIFIISLTQTAFCKDQGLDCWPGLLVFIMGPIAVFTGGPAGYAWFANPFLFLSWVFYKDNKRSLVFSICATIMGFYFFFCEGINTSEGIPSIEGSRIYEYSLGYWLWVSSMVIMVFGNLIFRKQDNTTSPDHDILNAVNDGPEQKIKFVPNEEKKYFHEGESKEQSKDYKGAIEAYTKAIEISPDYVNAYYRRGNVKFDNEDYKGAIEDYTIVIELKEYYAEAYFNRGYAKILSNANDGCSDLYKAKELGYEDPYDLINEYCK
jgi:tetratricopeptide (TPR) repeat protein